MKRSESINELTTALAKAQQEILPAPADRKGEVRGDKARYDFYYADLAGVREACREPLAKNGLAVVQSSHVEFVREEKISWIWVTVTTLLSHSSGQWIENELTLLAEGAGPQKIGICITYARRYELSALIGVAAEKDEDEGNGDQRPFDSRAPATQKISEGDHRPEPPPVGGEKASAGGGAAPASGEKTSSIRAVPSEAARKVIDSIGSANTQNELTAIFVQVGALPKGEQAEPRMAFVRQLGAYLEQPGHQATEEIGKLLTKSVTGLTDDQKAPARALHSRFFKSSAGSTS